jgi:hypothetical protein
LSFQQHYLRGGTYRASQALMRHLKALKTKRQLSILGLAHTHKRNYPMPIINNNLHGSKMLINLCCQRPRRRHKPAL